LPTTNADDQAKLLPFYLLVDVSYSMLEGGKLDQANEIIPRLTDALAANPIICDKVRFGVIDFSEDARLVLPLCDLLSLDALPALAVRGGTSFGVAFDALRRQIQADVTQLKADGFKVHRPTAFFLSDGEPTDAESDWRESFRQLTTWDRETQQGFPMYPNLIPFGVDQANPEILQQLIHPATGGRPMRMFLMDKGADAAQAIQAMAEVLIASVLQSGTNVGAGGNGIVLPEADELPAGVKTVGAEDDPWM
jgi:uncharacterized protein YegL